jgi:transposase
MNPSPMFVGIDVSKDHLDVAFRPGGEARRVANSEAGIAGLIDCLKAAGPELIVLESTGGFEKSVAVALTAAKLAARIVDPARARSFAKSLGQHSKTDAIDARVLAHFAEAVRPEARDLPDAETLELQALLDRRAQLMVMRTAERNRLHQGPTPAVRRGLQAHVKYLEAEIAGLDKEVASRIKAHSDWGPRDEILRSIPGVGDQTSSALLAHLPELGRLTGKRIAALAGLAPRARDSGTRTGERSIFGGRTEVRTSLYMSALSASRYNPALKAMYQRLRSAGKKSKVALTAVARKLLTIANAMIRDMKPWSPNHTPERPQTSPS